MPIEFWKVWPQGFWTFLSEQRRGLRCGHGRDSYGLLRFVGPCFVVSTRLMLVRQPCGLWRAPTDDGIPKGSRRGWLCRISQRRVSGFCARGSDLKKSFTDNDCGVPEGELRPEQGQRDRREADGKPRDCQFLRHAVDLD